MDVWLEYAVDDLGDLVHVSQAARGRSGLRCPYCQAGVLAKQGGLVAWHFAHAEKTCRSAVWRNDAPVLPLYHDFTLGLTPKEADALRVVHVLGSAPPGRLVHRLTEQGYCRWNPYRGRYGGYELTKLGQIPFGYLSLYLFAQVQAQLIEVREQDFAIRAHAGGDAAKTDLRIFRAQVQRIQASTLYFLAVQGQVSGEVVRLHKIGITSRPVAERVAEVTEDVREHVQDATVQVVDSWPGQGRGEGYFKFKYATHQYRLGKLTEYFAFDDPARVLRDLRRLRG